MKKPSTKIQQGTPEEIRQRFWSLFQKVNEAGSRATERDAKPMREMMDKHRDLELWRQVPGPGNTAITYLLQQRMAGAGISEAWRERASHLQKELGYDSASPAEGLLISHAVLCWLQLGFIELKYAHVINEGVTLAQGRLWDRRVTMAQRRFTRALTELERLRALAAAARYARARADEAERQRPRPNLSDEERAGRVGEILEAGRERLQTGPRALTA